VRIHQIPLTEVLKKYRGYRSSDFEEQNTCIMTHCPFPGHNDSKPSFALYDNTAKGKGWRYKCFSKCGGGDAVTMMCKMGIAKNTTVAREMLEKDFGIKPPDKWNVNTFAEYKGLDPQLLINEGWRVTDKEDGLYVPFYAPDGVSIIAEKVRHHATSSTRYHYLSGGDYPYGMQHLFTEDKSVVYITEGETDCLTLTQAGLTAIGIPSANAWKDEFTEHIKEFDKIVLTMDNDEAGEKLLTDLSKSIADRLYVIKMPSYEKDVNDYFCVSCESDTDIFNRRFAELRRYPATTDTFLSELPEHHELGDDKQAYKILSKQLNIPTVRDKFIKSVAKELGVTVKTISSMFAPEHNSNELFEDNNCYYKTIIVGGVPIDKKISNFVVRPKYIKHTNEGAVNVVTLVNEYDEVMDCELTPKELSNAMELCQKVISLGRNNFSGDANDLVLLRNIIFSKVLYTVNARMEIGHLKPKHWVFGNCGIDSTGNTIPIKDGLVTLDGEHYMPQSIVVNAEETTSMDDYLPIFNLDAAPLDTDELKTLAELFLKNIGGYQAWAGLGWWAANWFTDIIFERHRCFPFLFVVGKKGQGKTTFSRLISSAFGYSTTGRSFDSSSYASITRAMTYPHSMPIWYDDYKDSDAKDQKTQMLLGAYNRQGSDRANMGGAGIETRPVRANLLISGEYSPNRAALKERCVTVVMSGRGRCDTVYPDVEPLFYRLQSNGLRLAAASQQDNDFLSRIDHFQSILASRARLDARTIKNYAIVIAGFSVLWGDLVDIEPFIQWCIENADANEELSNEGHHITQFFNDITTMLLSDRSELTYRKHVMCKGGKLYLHKTSAIKLWQDYRKTTVNDETLKTDLMNEPYHCGHKDSRFWFTKDTQSRVLEFDYAKMKEDPRLSDFCSLMDACIADPTYCDNLSTEPDKDTEF
jgi:5S rRNA maturation endonuclease (ribonuclease M5)